MVKHAVAFSLVMLMLVCALNVATGASINRRLARARQDSVDKARDWPVGRQAPEDEGSSEDSDEDDEGTDDDAVLQQGQNNYAAQQAGESTEDSDEDGGGGDDVDDDDDSLIRRRRDAETKPAEAANEKEDVAEQQTTDSETAVDKVPETTVAPTTATVAPTRKSSVLVQIRDALKKVTTLPTEQVANNALQYFQLFEHFIQQTIETYIGDDDDEEEDVASALVSATIGEAPEGVEAAAVEVVPLVEKEVESQAPEASSTSSASVEVAAKPDSVGEKPATETAAPAVTPAAAPAEAANNAI